MGQIKEFKCIGDLMYEDFAMKILLNSHFKLSEEGAVFRIEHVNPEFSISCLFPRSLTHQLCSTH